MSNLVIRPASVLDIPFIFDLLTNSTLNDGSFNENNLTSTGYVSLFISLVAALDVWRQWLRHASEKPELQITEFEGEAIGFMHCVQYVTDERVPFIYLKVCVISPRFRNKGFGKKMVESLIERQARGGKVGAHCNRYAKAMQHIFKRKHFVRRSVGFGLEFYEWHGERSDHASESFGKEDERTGS